MRPASTALQDYLAANDTFVIVDLYTFQLQSGAVLRYSGWTTPLAIPGTAFAPGSLNYDATGYTSFALGPRFGRSKVTTKIGIEPTELDISILAGASDRVGALSFAEAVRIGQFDGATVELDRLFAPPQSDGSSVPDTSLGAIVWFYGRVAESDVGRSRIEVKVKSLLNLLAQQQMPRRLYQAACTHVFGDAMCGFSRASLAAKRYRAGGIEPGGRRYHAEPEPDDPLRPGHHHRHQRRQCRAEPDDRPSSQAARCGCSRRAGSNR